MRWWLLDPRNGASGDLRPAAVVGGVLGIASAPRTGSTLLGSVLSGTGLVGDPKEYLNPMQVRDFEARLAPEPLTRWRHRVMVGPLVPLAGRGRWTRARLAAYLTRVRAVRTGENGWFGLKIHHHHLVGWGLDAPGVVDALLGPVTWVRLTREDRVAQAVSWYRAMQTGRWASWQREGWPPVYSRAGIAGRLAAIEAAEAGWDRFFAGRVVPVLSYEEVAADPGEAAARVLREVGLGAVVPSAPSRLLRQADEVSAAWIARFRSGR